MGNIIFGIVFFSLALIVFINMIVLNVKNAIKKSNFDYEETEGTVKGYIDINDPEYIKKKRSEISASNEKSKKVSEFIEGFVEFVEGEEIEKVFEKSIEEQKNDPDFSPCYASIVEYKVDGKKYEIISEFSSTYKEPIGKKHTVSYDPKNPKDAFINNDPVNIVSIIFIIIFAGLGLISIFS